MSQAIAKQPAAKTPAPVQTASAEMEFTPFMGEAPIKLSIAIVQQHICVATRSGHICNASQAIKFMMLCRARKLNPFEGDAYLIGYDTKDGPQFSLITAHQAFLKRAEVHPEYDGMESGVIVRNKEGEIVDREGDFTYDDDVLLGAWATVHFKARKYPKKARLKLGAFRKSYGRWNDDPAGMIVKCFDDETEVLTTRGFEKFAEVQGAILQVTRDGLVPEPCAYPFSQVHSGRMIAFESDDLNFCVTPNHDMVTTSGKIEAGSMFEKSRSRAQFFIPRCVRAAKADAPIDDSAIRLAAIFLADGYRQPRLRFNVAVSRAEKIEAIEKIGLHRSRHVQRTAGKSVERGGRTITTKADKTVFVFDSSLLSGLVQQDKNPRMEMLLCLSARQARLFVDTLIEFDGHTNKKTGVRRFYSSNEKIVQAFEVMAVQAGYAVSNRKTRASDIGTKPNVCLTISDRSEIGVRRWNRDYHNLAVDQLARKTPSLVERNNATNRVWCVTVPSHVIVVRRHGFSMLCGNCAEADALRSSFPTQLGGMYLDDEMPVSVLEAASKATAEAAIPVDPQAAPATSSERMRKRLMKDEPTPNETPEERIAREYHATTTDAEVDRVYTSHCGPDGWCDAEQGQLSKTLRDQRVAALMEKGQGEMFDKGSPSAQGS